VRTLVLNVLHDPAPLCVFARAGRPSPCAALNAAA
jgi:hypothetical protein